MANSLTNLPILIDTDITTWRNDAAVVAAGIKTGIRVTKLMLSVGAGSAASAGTVTITAPSDSSVLYPTMVVGTQAANVVLFNDNLESTAPLTWKDFAVTGVTATKTVLYIWYQ